jgi:hypothetical protein
MIKLVFMESLSIREQIVEVINNQTEVFTDQVLFEKSTKIKRPPQYD